MSPFDMKPLYSLDTRVKYLATI